MTLGHDFSERSEREIISKEKGAQISTAQGAEIKSHIIYPSSIFT